MTNGFGRNWRSPFSKSAGDIEEDLEAGAKDRWEQEAADLQETAAVQAKTDYTQVVASRPALLPKLSLLNGVLNVRERNPECIPALKVTVVSSLVFSSLVASSLVAPMHPRPQS